MKTKSVKILGLTFILSLILSLSFVCLPKKQIQTKADADPTYTNYMLTDEGIQSISSTTKAGSLTINGKEVDEGEEQKFVLGEKNVTIVANANDGYVLKGWYILDNSYNPIDGTTNGYIEITDEEQSINNDLLTINTFATQNKQASLIIVEVFDNIKVAPVYDYEYFTVTVIDTNGNNQLEQTYKYGDTVTIEEDITANIDATGFTFSNEGIKDVVCKFTKDEVKLNTTRYNLRFTMSVYEDVEVTLNYDKLYQVDFKFYLGNDELTNPTDYQPILNDLTLKTDQVWDTEVGKYVPKPRYFSKLSNTSYFVKSNSNFELSVSNYIKNARGYVIYDFSSLDRKYGASNTTANYNGINSDTTVEIVYNYTQYKVEFVGVEQLSDAGNVQVNSSLNIPNDTTYTVKDSSIIFTHVANVGYNFLGFAQFQENTDIYNRDDYISEIALNPETPSNLKIYAIYQKIDYTIKLTNLTGVSLTNLAEDTVYPIASAELNGETKTGTEIEFEQAFHIGDSLTLKLYLNNGFNVTNVNGMTKKENEQVYTLELDETFLTGKENSISLDVTAETLKYSFTYRINKLTKEDDTEYKMADISILDKTVYLNTSEDGKYYEMVVENLTYYTTLTLNSTAYRTGSDGEYYVFKWFTTDFKTTLSGVTSNASTPETVSVNFVIYGDSVVYVVYSEPKTQLKIEINSAPAEHGISFVVKQTGNENDITADCNDLYTLEQNVDVYITINNLVNNENLFGYKFVNIELYTETLGNRTKFDGVDGSSQISYNFTPTSGDLYVVVINIKKIEYIFKITSENEGFSDIEKKLTIENSSIEFTKPTGYYVGKVQFVKGDLSCDYNAMTQDNSSRNGKFVGEKNIFSEYFYTFSTDKIDGTSEFEDIISSYGIEDDDNIIVNINITFYIYKYEIDLRYYKYYENKVDDNTSATLVYPTIEATYTLGEITDNAIKNNTAYGVKFTNIPYGASVTLKVVRPVSYGFTMAGWYDKYCGNSKTTNLNECSIGNITSDEGLSYKVNYNKYQIKLEYDNSQGNATVNNPFVKMDSSISIDANAKTSSGFIAKSITVNKKVYTEYEYTTPEQFALDVDNLVIKINGYVYSIFDNEYISEYEYYMVSEEVCNVGVDKFETNFNAYDYADIDNVITFNIAYEPIQMTISNTTKLVEKFGEDDKVVCEALDIEKSGLTIDQVATYTVKALKSGEERTIDADGIVTVDDVIVIDIQINQSAINSNGKLFNLAKGLELNLYYLNNSLDLANYHIYGNGSYQIEFAVAKNLQTEFIENKCISIDYRFQQIGYKTITAQTNMSGYEKFYKATTLEIKIDNNATRSEDTGSINTTNSFLSQANVSLDLRNLSDNFVINSVTAYKNKALSSNKIDNLEEYYITVKTTQQDTRVVVTDVELVLMDVDIIIQFNVQPRIYLERTEITTQNNYTFNRTYTIDDNGKGVAQTFTLGEELTNNIAGYEIDDEVMQVAIFDKNGNRLGSAVDVGEYVLKLELIDSTTESWLQYIQDLPFTIYLKISPLTIYLNPKVEGVISTEYYCSSEYGKFALTQEGNKLTASDGKIEISGLTANNREFNLGWLNFAYGYLAEIVLRNEDDTGYISQKNVTNGRANLLVTNLKLNNNPNFNLVLNAYVLNGEDVYGLLIENCIEITPKVVDIMYLDVYDKVYDGESTAYFGVEEGKEKLIVEYVYLSDDVSLDVEQLKIYFATRPINKTDNLDDVKTSAIGANRYIVIDARNALVGNQKNNYVIGVDRTGIINFNEPKTIYPYSISTTIRGVGDVTITNKRGLTDHTKAGLIPVNASLSVERFVADSAQYKEIYSNISSFLSRRNVFASGYKLSLIDTNGAKTEISNELYLTLPNEEELKQVLAFSADNAISVNYSDKGGNIEIDLKQIGGDIAYFALIQNRALLQTWQIVLIVVLSVVAVAGIGITVFFVVRKRKIRNDKYDTI